MLAALPGRRARRRRRDRSSSTPAPPTAPSRSPSRFGARVLHHEWTGDFSAARNVSLRRRDRRLDHVPRRRRGPRRRATAPRLRELHGPHLARGASSSSRPTTPATSRTARRVTHNALRLFRNRPEYRFEGRLHEQIAHSLPAYLPERLERTDVRIEHFGYLGAVRDAKEKSRRNIELLERQVAEGADTPVPALQPRLRARRRRATRRALEQFERVLGRCSSDGRAHRRLRLRPVAGQPRYVKALRAQRPPRRRASRAGDEVLELLPGLHRHRLRAGAAPRRALGDLREAPALLERCLEMGDAPEQVLGHGRLRHATCALVGLADVLRAQGRRRRGRGAAARAACRAPRLPRRRRAARRACCCAAAPEPPRSSPRRPRARRRARRPSVRFLLAVALYEAGAVAEAEAELRAVARRPARTTPPRAWRSPRRCCPRAAAPRPSRPSTPRSTPTRRGARRRPRRSCSRRLAAGDADAADGPRSRHAARGSADAERRRVRRLARPARRRGAPAALPADAAPLVAHDARGARARGGLRRVRATLAAVVEAARPARARAPRAAGRRLPAPRLPRVGRRRVDRRLPGAGPRRRALLGLAQVAYARGMPTTRPCSPPRPGARPGPPGRTPAGSSAAA